MSTKRHTKSQSAYAFDNTATNVAASQMRNALNNLADTVKDPEEKHRFENEMDNFFSLFRRYLTEKASGTTLEWDKIRSPSADEVVGYKDLDDATPDLTKLAVLKLNGGLGTSMGCVGPKSVIEVRDGNTFLDLSVRQIEHLNRKYDADVPLLLMNSFNTDADTAKIIRKYQGHRIRVKTFNQSKFPRIYKDSLLPVPESSDDPLEGWYPPGHGDLFEALVQSGELDALLAQGREILFVSNGDNLGATVDTKILAHMLETGAEYIMELTDKTRADVKGGTLINYQGEVRLLEIAQVPKEHVEEFKSIKKFKYFNTNNLWINLRAIKRLVEANAIEAEIIPNQKTIGNDINVLQLETAVGAAIRHFKGAHGVVVPRSRFLPVKTCSDLLLVKSDLFFLEHGALKLDPTREGFANPLIKLGSHFKKVSGFQARIPHMPKILELDHLTITGNVSIGKGVQLKGTVIIVCNDGDKIDIPNGSILENVVVTGNLTLLEH
ncbi:UTP-glucose-1-phosphate uridylyltransferase [Lodderomyces elongisporus]|uniref:UTP--glucose-1-phosphate uridylyltransferase n=1 Tax=Lodderomyces elongisporus (strain ATCC 11503 / CBS 2605 / JCM 1781 / NBRC 1676 / NRRL YB-4239) TaxID=379508 RepID=A5E0X6_LODEL|nr:UTP-glucose-1-phosphate uridylyltransferase [Lodderomyces elongisporus]EDK45084.1 UTP-glucose-1-phosphate uridylyltransferase [Lodderomyces elongisporus NRRL YB-4239]WLF79011.1 UTP-glucose-1-phosphate uridylyltransferase [Lodderomyces elongisporus]